MQDLTDCALYYKQIAEFVLPIGLGSLFVTLAFITKTKSLFWWSPLVALVGYGIAQIVPHIIILFVVLTFGLGFVICM